MNRHHCAGTACFFVLLLLVFLFLAGCTGAGGGLLSAGGAIKKANETAALSSLKKFSTAQSMLMAEEGRFSRDVAGDAMEGRFEGLLDHRLAQAMDPHGRPLNGYYFSEVRSSDPFRCGLAAYPARPGSTGDRVLMILLDERADHESQSLISGGNWTLYWADSSRVRGPVTSWPSRGELSSDWNEIRKRSPGEGLREARDLAGRFDAGKPVEDPVFGDRVR